MGAGCGIIRRKRKLLYGTIFDADVLPELRQSDDHEDAVYRRGKPDSVMSALIVFFSGKGSMLPAAPSK